MAFMKNTSYLFLPFSYAHAKDFVDINKAFGNNSCWDIYQDEIKYLLKYVAEKFDSRNKADCKCYHYQLNDFGRQIYGLGSEDDMFCIKGDDFEHRFRILSVHVYCFSSTVGIISVRVNFDSNDPLYITNAQYHLKKISRTKIFSDNAEDSSFTLFDVAHDMLDMLKGITEYDFFCYASEGTERANFLTLVDLPAKDSYEEELYYLRRCYSRNFDPTPEDDFEDITFRSVNNITWGISSEASVCIISTEKDKSGFLEREFYKNFNRQYMLMYIILLHQKYTLYTLMTKIGTGSSNDMNTLEEYRHNLYEFETDFVFACVTEVPQYQKVYELTYKAFSLEKMYEDVREPIRALSEIRMAAAKKEQRKRDSRLNTSIMLLSLLSIFSAIADGFQIAEGFRDIQNFTDDIPVMILKLVSAAVVLVIAGFVIANMLVHKKE